MSSTVNDLLNKTIETQAKIYATTGTVGKFPAYLGKGLDNPIVNVPITLSEYPNAQLAYFFTTDTTSTNEPRTRAFGSALNPSGYAQFGLPVWVGKHLESGVYIIVGRRDDDAGFYTSVGNIHVNGQVHGHSHNLFGPGSGGVADPVFISTRQIRDYGVAPTNPPSMQIILCADGGQIRTTTYGTPNALATYTSGNLAYLKPTSPGEARWVSLYANPYGTLGVELGDVFYASQNISSDVTFSKLSQIPFYCSPLAWIYFHYGQSTINWEHIRKWAFIGPSGRYKVNPNSNELSDLVTTPNPFNITYNLVLTGPTTNYYEFENTGIIKII